jgi:alpha-D-ribose 1-methylphosphonate 5-triphosphate synthase subunit PhnL
MNIEKVKIGDLVMNPNNPRTIKDDKFKKLVKSIKEFPEMLEVRPIVVDEDMIVLGGNMRLKACLSAGLEEVYIIRFENIPEEKKKEFIVKDNVGYGEWDFELLLEDWSKDQLLDWGLDIKEGAKASDDEEVLPENINAIFIDLKKKDKQRELYDKLIELGYSEKQINLMNFSAEEKVVKEVKDKSKIDKIGGRLEFNIDRVNAPKETFNVKYVLDKFDMESVNKESFSGVIDLDFEWNVGLIVGNSGTGKSTIAKELFGDNYITDFNYSDESILDNFGDSDVDLVIDTLTNVGLASTTTWLKPYSVLSGGEKMRCDLAKSLLSDNDLIVFDEFTSVVDRNIAKIGSFVVQKNVRKAGKKFIAVGCHFDVEDWLMPDWVFDTNEMKFYKYEDAKKKSDQVSDLKSLNALEPKKREKLGRSLKSITI